MVVNALHSKNPRSRVAIGVVMVTETVATETEMEPIGTAIIKPIEFQKWSPNFVCRAISEQLQCYALRNYLAA